MSIQVERTISVNEGKCVGCLTCQLRCSYRSTKSFNPAAAKIRVDRLPKGYGYKITFAADCDKCLLCARNCLYEALIPEGGEIID